MEIRDRYPQGVRISALSRETGHDRRTIRDIVRAAAPRPADPPGRGRAPRLLAPYEEYIHQRLQEGCWNTAVAGARVPRGADHAEGLRGAVVAPGRARACRPV